MNAGVQGQVPVVMSIGNAVESVKEIWGFFPLPWQIFITVVMMIMTLRALRIESDEFFQFLERLVKIIRRD